MLGESENTFKCLKYFSRQVLLSYLVRTKCLWNIPLKTCVDITDSRLSRKHNFHQSHLTGFIKWFLVFKYILFLSCVTSYRSIYKLLIVTLLIMCQGNIPYFVQIRADKICHRQCSKS